MFRIAMAALAAVWVFFASIDGNRTAHAADAATGPSFYVSGFGGLTFLEDAHYFRSGTFDSVLEHDVGGGGGFAVGYRWPFGLRTEFELSYRVNNVDSQTIGGTKNFVSDVHTHSFAYLVNFWYDINTGTGFLPYIGGGLGGATLTLDNAGVVDSDGVFAWQIGGGLGYQIVPSVVLFTDYRWLATEDMVVSPGTPDLEMEYSSHNVMFGVRVHF